VLFQPLGIKEYRWYEDSKGISIGGFGLCLKTEDMLKIGLMMLSGGVFQNRRIVSEEWIKQSTVKRYHTYNKIGSYGYHWWVLTNDDNEIFDPHIYFSMGYGGQYIMVNQERNRIVVFTSELYNDTFLPLRLAKNYIFID